MNFQISSEKIGNPLLIELLRKLTECFEKANVPFYIIGATARDILIRQMLDVASQRRTKDLDIAIAIPDWSKLQEVTEILISAGLKKSAHTHQRFFMGEYELDVVPYGGVAKVDDNIYWPPEEEIAMSVKGFDEVLEDSITVSIDGEFDIKIASLHGLFLLKFNAWMDRHHKTNKDASDMSFILENYFEANVERNFHSEVYEREDFDVYIAGSNWLAYDLIPLLTTEQIVYYRDCIKTEVDKEEESLLISQMMDSRSSLKYEMVRKAWQEIAAILNTEFQNRQELKEDESKIL